MGRIEFKPYGNPEFIFGRAPNGTAATAIRNADDIAIGV
jgi:hypothetical protein